MQVASLKMNLKQNLNSLLISDSNNVFSLCNVTHMPIKYSTRPFIINLYLF